MNEFLFNNSLDLLWIIASIMVIIGVSYWARRREKKCEKTGLIALTTLYSALVVASVVAATKIIEFKIPFLGTWLFPDGIFVPAGVIVYAASFLVTDLISEVYGKKEAMTAVWLGFAAMLIFSLYSLLMTQWTPAPYWANQEAFESVVGLSFRITLAGVISFLFSQSWDVMVFHWLKKENSSYGKPKHLWIRNNVSTVTSQFIDSVLFISIAFIGEYDTIISMIIAQWFIKCIIALIDTPFAYWGRYILMPPIEKPKGFCNTIKAIINHHVETK
jgi:uncharacterized integral membrane protein (TIGR00697 family)